MENKIRDRQVIGIVQERLMREALPHIIQAAGVSQPASGKIYEGLESFFNGQKEAFCSRAEMR